MKIEKLYQDLGGRGEIRERVVELSGGKLKVSQQQLTDWIAAEKIPSSWYTVFEQIALERGKKCPRELFNFKAVAAA